MMACCVYSDEYGTVKVVLDASSVCGTAKMVRGDYSECGTAMMVLGDYSECWDSHTCLRCLYWE